MPANRKWPLPDSRSKPVRMITVRVPESLYQSVLLAAWGGKQSMNAFCVQALSKEAKKCSTNSTRSSSDPSNEKGTNLATRAASPVPAPTAATKC